MNVIEKFTKFAEDFATSTPKLFVMSRLVKIGPSHMTSFTGHTAYNAAAFSVAAILVLLTVNYMSPAAPIDFSLSVVVAALTILFFSVVGFFVNLATPNAGTNSVGDIEANAISLANKWATYSVFCFFITLFVYAIIYCTALKYFGEDIFTYCAFREDNLCLTLSFLSGHPEIGVVLFSSFVGTGVVYASCYRAQRIVDHPKVVASLFFFTATAIFVLAYLLLFVLFV